MKVSQVIVIIMLIVVGVSAFFLVKNENRNVIQRINESGQYETFKPENEKAYSEGYSRSIIRTSKESFEIDKREKRNKILFSSGGILIGFLIVFRLLKANENKNNPIKNLKNLKQDKIISESEYQEKIEYSKIIDNKKKVLQSKKKQYKKLLGELNSLKSKGILTEEEYKQKLIKINENTGFDNI